MPVASVYPSYVAKAEKKGDLKKARASWQRALTLKPDPENKTRLDEKLRKTENLDAKK